MPNPDDLAVLQPLIVQLGLDPAHPLSSQLDGDGKAKLSAFEASYGLLAERMDVFRPWLAALTFSVIPIMKSGYDPKGGVDSVLRTMARAQSKPLMGFETMEQQMHMFADMPQQKQIDYLLFTLGNAQKDVTQLDVLVDAWAPGDTAKMETFLNGELFAQQPARIRRCSCSATAPLPSRSSSF